MRAPTAAGWLLLLGLFLLPYTVYVGAYRAVPAPFIGGGLENCGFVLTPRNPAADPTSLALCDPPRREATVRFAALAAGEFVLLLAGAGLAGQNMLRGRHLLQVAVPTTGKCLPAHGPGSSSAMGVARDD